jgi:cell division protein FtsQ
MKLYQPKKKKKKLGRKIIVLAVLALIVFGGFKGCQLTVNAIMGLPAFKITEITVTAPPHIQKDQILALSGFSKGTGIYEMSLGDAKRRIRTHPWVKKVRIKRSLPSNVVITIQSREVKALTKIDSMIYYLDHEGKLIGKLIPGFKTDLPVINAKPEEYQKIIALLDEISSASAFTDSDISEVFMEDDIFTVYPSDENVKIQLSISKLDQSLNNLKKVWDDLKERGETASMIDATLPGNKVVVSGIKR